MTVTFCKHEDIYLSKWDWYGKKCKKGKHKGMAYYPAPLNSATAYGNYNTQTETIDFIYYQHAMVQQLQSQLAAWTNNQTAASTVMNPMGLQGVIGNLGNISFTVGTSVSTVNASISAEPPTEEQRRQWEAEAEERRKKAVVAASRAEELLFSFIGDDRKKQYAEFGHFDVPVNGRVYRIQKGRSNNVLLLENGAPKMKYCAHPADYVPDGDTMLAQFLMLTTNEQRFLEIANKSPWHADGGAYNPVNLAVNNILVPAEPDELARLEEQAFAAGRAEEQVALAA